MKKKRDNFIQLCVSCHSLYDWTSDRNIKISIAHTGKSAYWNNEKIKSIDKLGNERVYDSLKSASKLTNTSRTAISNVLIGRAFTSNNLIWKYAI